jgi:hypothetical protein
VPRKPESQTAVDENANRPCKGRRPGQTDLEGHRGPTNYGISVMNKNGIDLNRAFLTWHRPIAAMPVLFGLAAAVFATLASLPTTRLDYLSTTNRTNATMGESQPAGLRRNASPTFRSSSRECCVTCNGVTACGCAVQMTCGSCCSGLCCDSPLDGGGEGGGDEVRIDKGMSISVGESGLTITLLQLEPTIELEVASADLPKRKLSFEGKTTNQLVVGGIRFDISVKEAAKGYARLKIRKVAEEK